MRATRRTNESEEDSLNTLDNSRQASLHYWVLFAYRWLVVAPFLALSTIVLSIPIAIMCFAGYPNAASRIFARAWARSNAAVSLMTVEIKGREKMVPGESYVIVANHQSLVDIYVIYGYLSADIKWVMKKELRAVPFLGFACDLMGHIYIDRSDTESALQSIADAQSRIQNGISAVFFPEGTRSRDGSLAPFKRGAFRFAIDIGKPILPVTIHDTRRVLPSDTTEIVPGHAWIEIGDPISTEGLTPDDTRRVAEDARAQIENSLKQAAP